MDLARQCQIRGAPTRIGAADERDGLHRRHGRDFRREDRRAGQEHFDLWPKGIIQMLDLLRLIYAKTAAYGHFGREEPELHGSASDSGGTAPPPGEACCAQRSVRMAVPYRAAMWVRTKERLCEAVQR